MSDDRKETFSLDGGKYEIDRNQAGLMIGARRHGEPWPAGFEQLRNMGVVHAMLDRIEADREAMQQALEAQPEPIDMVLHCPACGMQHIDAPSDDAYDGNPPTWNNPPHRSHLCHGCGHVWRPADVPTNGVAAVKTKGKNDTAAIAEAETVEPVAKIGWAANITNRLRELADAVTRGPDAVASEFTMSVPARPERDADLVLSAAADEIERLRATLDRQQLSYEREREIDQDEIERLIALRRDDARALDAERAGRAAAVLAMRERCAQVCDDEARLWEAAGNGPATEARLCAARIRSLA